MNNMISTGGFGGGEFVSPSEARHGSVNPVAERFMLALTIAKSLMCATLIPDHLRGERKKVQGEWQLVAYSPEQVCANVLMVVNRALQWNVDPVALIGESFVIGGKLDFQGKVIIAIVNRLGGVQKNLEFTFSGKEKGRTVTVIGTLKNETTARTIQLDFATAATYNSRGELNEQWAKDVDSKLAYSGAKKWARRHAPEVVLGLFGEDDEPVTVNAVVRPAIAYQESPIKTTVRMYEELLTDAATRSGLTVLVDKIKSEPQQVLSLEDREYLVSMAKLIWSRKPVTTEQSPADTTAEFSVPEMAVPDEDIAPLLDEKLLHYEAMITEAISSAELDRWITAIDTDEHLPIAMKKQLGKFSNERHRKGFEVATA